MKIFPFGGFVRVTFKPTGETFFVNERVKQGRRFFYRIDGVLVSGQHVSLDNSPHS